MHLSLTSIAAFFVPIALLTSSCDYNDSERDALKDTYPYVTKNEYSRVLRSCAIVGTTINSCTLNELPPLGMEHPSPTISNIMERVLVSHDWMGERFEQLLENTPTDIHQLLGGVTAIVIDDDTRPSYYHNLTGAIYLDPANLWITQDEKLVINRKEDHRAAYADPMAFRSWWRYTKDHDRAFKSYSLNSTEDRTLDDIILPMASLLYHELAHANDIFPVSSYYSVNKSKSIYDITESLKDSYPSTLLKTKYPLESPEMTHFADILYKGASPSEEDTQVTAAQVGAFFATDSANDDYAYTSQYEDVAMLLEEAMMKFHFNVDRDTAYIDYAGDGKDCDEQKVAWGVRNRIGEERVKQRLQVVLEQLLPSEDYTDLLNDLPEPRSLPNTGWCESITFEQPADEKSSAAMGMGKPQSQSRKFKSVRQEDMTRLYKIHY